MKTASILASLIVVCSLLFGCASIDAKKASGYLSQASVAASAITSLTADGNSPLSEDEKHQVAGWAKWVQFGISMAATTVDSVK